MSKNSIWITGAEGRLGSALVQLLNEDVENKVVGTDRDVDVTDMEAVEQAANVYHPNIVINCASISDVECCEKNMVEAFRVNALGARNLASVTRRLNAKLIQLSTDDVFDGKNSGRMTEFDIPDPQTVYGKSKFAGENYVKELNPKHLIIRSSWVYGAADGKKAQDYFSYVVQQGEAQASFEAPFDRISTPTSAGELARFINCLLDKTEYGIYHASCEGVCSRYEFARTILALMGYDSSLVKGTFSSNDGKQVSTLLENLMMKMTEIYTMPQWIDDLKAYVAEYNG
ncbi:MAG: NAD(P)-dependent oxidoreductase [Bacteroidales bacterium]|nr:NAD(P)-dependent oxidoreductase [Clostridium sp.]MCM1203503.1 NAD(P)-dependent oxidoreductase [Bacteroidales bacterium]